MKTLIGYGILGWLGSERRSDRYGTVSLFDGDSNDKKLIAKPIIHLEEIKKLVGKKGKLEVEVLHTRQSTHIGDLFRGFSPSTPKKGQRLTLGEGKLFTELVEGINTVGLRPDDGRDSDWLQPEQLYKAHEQTVNLYFVQ
jgi:hypothetical protein